MYKLSLSDVETGTTRQSYGGLKGRCGVECTKATDSDLATRAHERIDKRTKTNHIKEFKYISLLLATYFIWKEAERPLQLASSSGMGPLRRFCRYSPSAGGLRPLSVPLNEAASELVQN